MVMRVRTCEVQRESDKMLSVPDSANSPVNRYLSAGQKPTIMLYTSKRAGSLKSGGFVPFFPSFFNILPFPIKNLCSIFSPCNTFQRDLDSNHVSATYSSCDFGPVNYLISVSVSSSRKQNDNSTAQEFGGMN